MTFRELFNVPVVVRKAPANDLRPRAPRDISLDRRDQRAPEATGPRNGTAGETEVQRQGAFITVQSLVTFPGAVAAVTVIVNVVGWAMPRWAGKPLLFVIASALIGLAIYFINEKGPKTSTASGDHPLVAIIIAILNTLVILSAAVGTDSMIRNSGAPQAEVQTQEVANGTE